MKRTSHIIKYWLLNRITCVYAAFAAVITGIMLAGLSPELNGTILSVSFLLVILALAYIDESGNKTASERLMLRRLARIC